MPSRNYKGDKMADSADVLGALKLVYTIYCISIILLIGWFARGVVAPEGKPSVVKPSTFYGYVGVLVFVGVAIHILTFNKIPWVEIDFKRDSIQADQTFNITVKDHKFNLPQDRLVIQCKNHVLFDVDSKDLTYGFGLFRQDSSLVLQMQVVPGSTNQIMWQFHKNGVYNVMSTEYSGPHGSYEMTLKNAVEVVGCDNNDKYAMLEVK